MDYEAVRNAIAKRKCTDDEWEYGCDRCRADLFKALAQDRKGTELFLLNECSAEELVWISEIFDELVEYFPDRKFVDALRQSIKRYPKEDKRFNLNEILDGAEKTYIEE